MATEKTYNGDGSDKTFDITFPYLTHADIAVSVGGVTKTVGSDYTITGDTVTFTTAPVEGTDNVKLFRNTNIDTPEHTYEAGSSITSASLNANQKQALYAIEEAKSVTVTSGGVTTGNKNDITVNSDTDWVIRSNAIEKSMITDNCIGTNEIEDNAVTTGKIANNAITGPKIADNAIEKSMLLDSCIGTNEIEDNAVTGAKLSDNLDIPDNNKIRFGTSGPRLEIYHDGTDSYIIESGTGDLKILGSNIEFKKTTGSERFAYFMNNGASSLYYDNIEKFSTTDYGINIKDDNNVKILLTPTDSDVGSGKFAYNGNSFLMSANSDTARIEIQLKSGNETAINCIPDDAVELYYNNTKKFYTYSTGIKVVGHVRPDANDSYNVGVSASRWDNIYATNGSINTSDKNEKNTITTSDLGLDFVNKLKPVSYKFNNKTRTHYGLISQDIETLLSDISKPTSDFAGFIKEDISENGDGSKFTYGLRYHEFISPLIKAVQELSAEVTTLKTKVAALESG